MHAKSIGHAATIGFALGGIGAFFDAMLVVAEDERGAIREGFEDVAVVRLNDKDVVRHPLVGRMLSVL